MRDLTRRTLLRGFVGGVLVSIALPPLERFLNTHGSAYADTGASGFPQRFGMFTWGNGVVPERWVPAKTGAGTEWELSDELAPLAAHKEKLIVLSGLNVPFSGEGEPHFETACRFMVGKPLLMNGDDWTFSGPTFDQVYAKVLGENTRFRSLEFGVNPKSNVGLTYTGPFSVNPAEMSPFALFERVFGGTFNLPGSGETTVDPSLGIKRSVLDGVMDDITTLKGTVSSADQIRLDQHFEGIRSIEKQLAALQLDPPDLAACSYPNTPNVEYEAVEGLKPYKEMNAAFATIIAHALVCDQTRVFTNSFSGAVQNSALFPGFDESHHSLTHFESDPQPLVHDCTVFCVEAFEAQISALAALPEGDGSLLDHMLVMGTSDCAEGKIHSGNDFPIVLAGSADGRLKTDIHWRSNSGDLATRVPLTIGRTLGLDLPSFGEGEHEATKSIGEIEV